MAGIYVHIPFCSQFCTYCNFYSIKGKGYREKYIAALYNEIEYKKDFFADTGVSPRTIYFGGGTPSLFLPSQLGEVLAQIIKVYKVEPEEVSIEVNPDDITPQYATQLRAAGFNRISMGVQSFVDEHLQWMNRRHTSEQAVRAYYNLRDAGFGNISLDLIFGYQSLTPELWKYNLSRMVELSPEHISAYQMSIEPGSALGKLYEQGGYNLPPDNICHLQYTTMQQYLADNGYEQYEVSNFAKRDAATGGLLKSRHNSSYWTKESYLGLGPAAHSFNGIIRSWNNPGIVKYCGGSFSEITGFEELSGRDMFNESIMLGLRTVEGVELGKLDSTLLGEIKNDMLRHCRMGNLVLEGDRIKIPLEKLFVSDSIIRDLFV